MTEFGEWIISECSKRGWSIRQLSGNADVSYGTLQGVIKTGAGAGPKFCRGIARAFGVPPEDVFRRAGLLDAIDNPGDHTLKQIYEAAQLLTVEQRVTALKIILGLKS